MFQIPENPKHHSFLDLEVVMKAASVFPAALFISCLRTIIAPLCAHSAMKIHEAFRFRSVSSSRIRCIFCFFPRSPGQDEVASVSSLREELFRIATESQKERRGGKNGGRTKISERTLKEQAFDSF